MKNFKVDKVKFTSTLAKLVVSKLYSNHFTEDHIALYWQDLKSKRYIIEVMEKARHREYKSRMPLISELIDDHKKYSEEIGRKMIGDKYLVQSKSVKRLSSNGNGIKKVNSIPLDIINSIKDKLK